MNIGHTLIITNEENNMNTLDTLVVELNNLTDGGYTIEETPWEEIALHYDGRYLRRRSQETEEARLIDMIAFVKYYKEKNVSVEKIVNNLNV